jgi:hypothetical protein
LDFYNKTISKKINYWILFWFSINIIEITIKMQIDVFITITQYVTD